MGTVRRRNVARRPQSRRKVTTRLRGKTVKSQKEHREGKGFTELSVQETVSSATRAQGNIKRRVLGLKRKKGRFGRK